MANRRVLVKRRKAARNIRKITRTMQLIATARFQTAHRRAVATKPYTRKLSELVADLSRAAEGVDHPLLGSQGSASRSELVVITSNRGLCGGYNSNVLRAAVEHLERQAAEGLETDVRMVGKKGASYFRFIGRPVAARITDIGDAPRFEQVEPIANELMRRLLAGEIASAWVAYMRFVSAGRQEPAVTRLLPLSAEGVTDAGGAVANVEFEFSPDPQTLLGELLPATVRASLYQAFTDAAVSEQVARMVAMKAATDAAEEMIKGLTRQYNRARQTQITMELLDIVGGANAIT